MGPYIEESLLSWLVFTPMATALLLLASGAVGELAFRSKGLPAEVWRAIAMGGTLLTLLFASRVWGSFDPELTGYQLIERGEWLPSLGVHYFVGIDGISLVLVSTTAFLMPVVLLATWNEVGRALKSYVVFLLFLETSMLGAFVSLNLFQFYVFWELMLVLMYFVIVVWGGPRRVQAATKFFLFTLLGSLLMLVALLVVHQLNFEQGGVPNFDLVTLPGGEGLGLLETLIPLGGASGDGAVWWKTQLWLFLALGMAFAIKVPLVPLHGWLPDAHSEAPTAGTVALAAVLLKVGAYAFVRIALPLFPAASFTLTPIILTLALVGVVYGSLLALVERDLKRLVAYASLANMGLIVVGVFAGNLHGMTGAVVQMVSHALCVAALFLLVGFIQERRGTRELSELGGLARPMPVFAALFGVVLLANMGLPFSSGFVGELLILLGSFRAGPAVAVTAAAGMVLAVAALLRLYRGVLLGPLENPENRRLIDLDLRERVAVLALIVPVLWIGVYPNPILRRVEPSVSMLLQSVERHRNAALESAARAMAEADAAAAEGEPEPGAEGVD
ncbi:MAG: NADH-quinone oxidoreductase subunit M [Deltaproteobacteria bacterium]|nr:NADH-quinone oxidoreductase subunit M [Deltaproteobacteria bacterium]